MTAALVALPVLLSFCTIMANITHFMQYPECNFILLCMFYPPLLK